MIALREDAPDSVGEAVVAALTRGSAARRVIHGLSLAFGALAALSILLLMVLPTVNVVLRTAYGGQLAGAVESSEVIFALAGTLGLGVAYLTGGHVASDALTARLPATLSRILELLGLVVAAVWIVWLLAASWQRTLQSVLDLEVRFGLHSIPVWPARVAIAVGFLTLLLEIALRIVDRIREFRPAERRAADPVDGAA